MPATLDTPPDTPRPLSTAPAPPCHGEQGPGIHDRRACVLACVSTLTAVTTSRNRLAGTVGLAAGLAGVVAAAGMAVYPAQVGDDWFSYPFEPGVFAVVQVVLALRYLGCAVLLSALWTRTGLGRIGVGGSVLSMAGLAVLELISIGARDEAYPSPRTDSIELGYAVASLAIGVFAILAGIAVARARRWDGWRRYLPLALGVYVFVPLIPGILGPFVLDQVVIGGWMALFALLGWTVRTS